MYIEEAYDKANKSDNDLVTIEIFNRNQILMVVNPKRVSKVLKLLRNNIPVVEQVTVTNTVIEKQNIMANKLQRFICRIIGVNI